MHSAVNLNEETLDNPDLVYKRQSVGSLGLKHISKTESSHHVPNTPNNDLNDDSSPGEIYTHRNINN